MSIILPEATDGGGGRAAWLAREAGRRLDATRAIYVRGAKRGVFVLVPRQQPACHTSLFFFCLAFGANPGGEEGKKRETGAESQVPARSCEVRRGEGLFATPPGAC